jgi:hypothetical protein
MTAKDIFGIAVRLIGLLFFYQGLNAVPTAITSICPAFPHFYFRNIFPAVLLTGWPLLLAVWLIRGAPWLMRQAYGQTAEETRGTGKQASPFGGPTQQQ